MRSLYTAKPCGIITSIYITPKRLKMKQQEKHMRNCTLRFDNYLSRAPASSELHDCNSRRHTITNITLQQHDCITVGTLGKRKLHHNSSKTHCLQYAVSKQSREKPYTTTQRTYTSMQSREHGEQKTVPNHKIHVHVPINKHRPISGGAGTCIWCKPYTRTCLWRNRRIQTDAYDTYVCVCVKYTCAGVHQLK